MAGRGPRRDRTWALALLVSLLLHAGIGLVLTRFSGPAPRAAASGPVSVDSCAVEPDEGGDNFLLPSSDLAPMQAVLVAPPAGIEPADPAPSKPILQAAAPPEPTHAGGEPLQLNPSPLAPRPSPLAPPGTRFFEVNAQGLTFVYVIDRSSSMGPNGGLRAAREQLLASLQQLPPTAKFQIIVYNRVAEPLIARHPLWMEVTPENREQVSQALGKLLAEGGTDHLPALRCALALHPDVLFFLTDADDLTAGLLRTVAQLNSGRRTVIHAIELTTLHRDRPDMPMHVLALENRGTYRAVELRSSDE